MVNLVKYDDLYEYCKCQFTYLQFNKTENKRSSVFHVIYATWSNIRYEVKFLQNGNTVMSTANSSDDE